MSPALKTSLLGIASATLVSLGAAMGALANEAPECPVCEPCAPVAAIEPAPVAEVVAAPVLSPDADKAPLSSGAITASPLE